MYRILFFFCDQPPDGLHTFRRGQISPCSVLKSDNHRLNVLTPWWLYHPSFWSEVAPGGRRRKRKYYVPNRLIVFCLSAINLLFEQQPDQSIRWLPFRGDPLLSCPKTRHFFISPKKVKTEFWRRSDRFAQRRQKKLALSLCQSTEILV